MEERDRELKARHRAMWALGDYPKVASDMVSGFGPELVTACGIRAGQRVLDVAAGTGNVAIPAAQTGAHVVASDLTPELLEAGHQVAESLGVELEWVEADAEALPFGDGEFDVVTSSIGAMFAPHHQVVADELVRVCRPGGTIGMINFTPEGWVGDFFRVLAPFVPPLPPGTLPPVLWGSEQHVRELFGDRVDLLDMTRRVLVLDQYADAAELCDYYKANFGPVIAAYRNVAADSDRTAELDREFQDFLRRSSTDEPGGPARYELEYLLVVAHKRVS